jgi:hypothetical protein
MSKFQKFITILFCAGMFLAFQPSGYVQAQSCPDGDPDVTCTDNDGDGYALEGGACGAPDCDDEDDATHPFAPKLCDGRDNNCDGKRDYPTDVDNDMDGVPYCALDCDDNNPNIFPFHQEGPLGHVTCSDNIDNDCDYYFDETDNQCQTPCLDIDEDGYGQNGHTSCTNGTIIDCNDINPDINPGVIDDNCDTVDDNCSGTPDDQYIPTPTNCGVGSCFRSGQIECQSGVEIDTCAPGDPVYEGPQGDAKCFGGSDEDCDELIDEEDPGCLTSCIDQDGDGYGLAGDPACPNGTEIDCDDTDASRNPGADDSNCNGFDEDCDLIEDDDFQVISTSCGIGACSSNGLLECLSGVATDSCSPGTPEPEGPYQDVTCSDNSDNDCDGYEDAADILDCSSPDVDDDLDGLTENEGDCDDSDNTVYPKAPKLCDGKDNNCDGKRDYQNDIDEDSDGFPKCALDCDDNNPNMFPSHPEGPFGDPSCSDCIDNNCNGLIDADDTGCDETTLCGNSTIDNDEACDDGAANGDTVCGCQSDCTYTPVATSCADGEFCNGDEICDGSGTCQPGTPVDCSDGVGCTDDACDENVDVCVSTANDANCIDDGEFCTGDEFCDQVNDCSSTGDPCAPGETCDDTLDICEPPIDCGNGILEQGEACDEGTDNGTTVCGCQSDCTYTPVDTSCADGAFCNGDETCNGAGACQAGTPPVIDDGVGCTDDSCDEVNDVVVNAANDANCDNGDFCDGSETCDAINDCQVGTPPCDPATETCDEVQDICVEPSGPDIVAIEMANWVSDNNGRLEVWATSSENESAELRAHYDNNSYIMDYDVSDGRHEIIISDVDYYTTVDVTSSLGGSASSGVDSPENCGSGDTMVIDKAEWRNKQGGILDVTASYRHDPSISLTVTYGGETYSMDFTFNNCIYKLRLKPIPYYSTLEVTASTGVSETGNVQIK